MDDAGRLFEELIACLRSQEEIVERLASLGQAQYEALRQNSLEELGRTVREQEACAAAMEAAEQKRLLVLEELEKELHLEKGVSLSLLLPFSPAPAREILQQHLVLIREKITKLQELNNTNAGLIKKSMLVNGRIMKILTSGTATTYGLKGEVRSGLGQAPSLDKSV